jgi:hypothetical protein
MNSLDHLIPLGLAVAAGLGTACLSGLFEQELRAIIGTGFAILLRPFILINSALEAFWGSVKSFFRSQFTVNGILDPQGVVFRFIGSMLYLIFFLAFTFSDFHLLALSLVAIGIDAGHFNPPMGAGTLTALSVIASILFWGAVISDLMGMTNTAPWRESLNGRWRRCLLVITIICLLLSLVVTASMGLYRGKVIADEGAGTTGNAQPTTGGLSDLNTASSSVNTIEPLNTEGDEGFYYWVPIVANVCIPVLVLAGGVFSSWGLVMVIKFGILLAAFIAISPLWLVWLGASIVLNIVDRLYQFLDAVLQLFAATGRRFLGLFGWRPGSKPASGGTSDPAQGDPEQQGASVKTDSNCTSNGEKEQEKETVTPSSNGWDPFGN